MKRLMLQLRPFAEASGSLLIAAFTGLHAAAGLILAAYLLATQASAFLTLAGLAALTFGIVNVPILILWSLQSMTEIGTWLGRPDAGPAIESKLR